MSARLADETGAWIDRTTPIAFTFEGRSYGGFAGDTIASALIAGDRWLISRSFKYHRPRGPVSLAGHEANTLVQIGDAPFRRHAWIEIEVREGEIVRIAR